MMNFLRFLGRLGGPALLGLAIGAVVVTVLVEVRPESNPQLLPAIFDGEGAVVLGCAFWGVPSVTPFSEENPDVGVFVISASGSKQTPRRVTLAVDGPHGFAIVSGEECGVEIDWRRFPAVDRPGDKGE